MKLNKFGLLFFSTVLACFSCQQRNNFETTRGGYDYIRIPFLKPYEAVQLNGSKEWNMNLYNESLTSSVSNIKKINIVNNVILLYSTKTLLNGTNAEKVWFIIIPSKKVEQGFVNYYEFLTFLHQRINGGHRLRIDRRIGCG